MSRPDYPKCIMTPEIIHRIREEQECYDRDPERYERERAEYEEMRMREQAEQMAFERMQEENRRDPWDDLDNTLFEMSNE